ncbi:hypothetical protein U2F10_06320 [Leptothoe sp. EHU-05/26/07-4]
MSEIPAEQYRSLIKAQTDLLQAMFIEEHLNLVLDNYFEFENELIKISLKNAIFPENYSEQEKFENPWCASVEEVFLVNRRVINLLSSGSLYVSVLEHAIHKIYSKDSQKYQIVKKLTSQEYDSNRPGYRVICALRNHSQHYDIPFQQLTNGIRRVEEQSKVFRKISTAPKIMPKQLKNNKEFKAKILKELEDMGELVELTPLIRQYMDSLGNIHRSIRDAITPDLLPLESILAKELQQHKKRTGWKEGLQVIVVNELDKIVDSTNIFNDFVQRRKMLVFRNHNMHFSSRFVTSESSDFYA